MDKATLKLGWRTALSTTNLSVRALARETGISHTYLRAIVAGKTLPSDLIRKRLLDYFKGCSNVDLFGQAMPAGNTAVAIICKRCRSPQTIKSGLYMGAQRYQCKDCGCVFVNNNAPLHSRIPVAAAVIVMELFFAGEPLDSIRRLVQESEGTQITVTGLESLIYRYSSQAVRLTEETMPEVSSSWLVETTFFQGVRPVIIMDVLDVKTGFIIASDLMPDYAEKDRETAIQRALRITGSFPESLSLGPVLAGEFEYTETGGGPTIIPLESYEGDVLQKYDESRSARTRLVTRRLNFDSIANNRLICAAWRANYNFLSDFKPGGQSAYNSWLDIVNETSLILPSPVPY